MKLPTCQICQRNLTDQQSIARGVGPECLAKRERFLAASGSNDHEIAELALSGDPTVERWIRKVGAAIAAGRQDHVNIFLAAARNAKAAAERMAA